MTYIYDILLNFNNNLIEHFEWEEKDKIKYVKKVILFKVPNKIIKDIAQNKVLLDTNFTNKIPKYEMNGEKNAGSICLLTDGLIVIGLLIKQNKVEKVSRLLLDEEEETLEISENINMITFSYEILEKRREKQNNLTRKENIIKETLEKEIKELYKNNEIEKLIYIYYEFTNKENNNIEHIYKTLTNSLKDFNDKHIKIFKILHLSKEKQK